MLDGIVALPKLSGQALIKFDERAVPYIEASSDHDLYCIQGYATAAQRFFQMDMLRRTAKGELSELLGASLLSEDKLNRMIGFNRIAADEWKRLSKESRSNLQAYCDGINAYLSQYHGKEGIEYTLLAATPRRWSPTDSLAILKYRQYQLDESWRLDDMRQRIIDKAGEKVASKLFNQVLQKSLISSLPANNLNLSRFVKASSVPIQPTWGSNAWLVGAPLSDSKGALLACDKHTAFSAPDPWFFLSLTTGEIHVAGASIPGVPAIFMGRNENIGWAGVSLKADTQDLFVEQFSPQFPTKYRTPTGWQNAVEVTEEIPIRFANPLIYKVLSTRHGPILLRNDTAAVAMSWSGADSTTTPVLETMFQINRAKNWQDFCSALSRYSGASETFVYADRNGNIGYHAAGNIPIHTTGSGNQLMPGWIQASDWIGRAGFASLPNSFQPPQNFAVADDPANFASFNFNNPYRAMRIASVLQAQKASGQKVGLPDMADLQGDTLARLAPLLKKEIIQAATRAEVIDRYQLSAISELKRWDGVLKPDSVAAAIYESFLINFTRRILEPKLGTDLTLEYLQRWPRWSVMVEHLLTEKGKDWLPPEERTYETFLITTFGSAVKNIRVALKTDDQSKWSWQNLHQITFHPLFLDSTPYAPLARFADIGPVGVGGDQDTVNACNTDFNVDPWLFRSNSGPTARLLLDMSNHDQLFESTPLGQSGHLSSANRSDQLTSWQKLEPHSVAFSESQLDKQMQHKLFFQQ